MKLPIPNGSILKDPITIGEYKFFYLNGQVQCATCLMIMGLLGEPKEMGKVRELYIDKQCDCPPQL